MSLERSKLSRCSRSTAVLAAASIAFALLPAMAHAGAWGTGAFENDDSLDLLAELDPGQGGKRLEQAFGEVKSSAEYIEAPACSMAIAAATLVASAAGAKIRGLPPEASQWLQTAHFHPTASLRAEATNAVRACSDPKRSELSQLWAEGKDGATWQREIQTLLGQLAALKPAAAAPDK